MEANFEALAQQLAGSHVRVAKYQADVDKEWATANLGLTTFPTIVMLPKAKSGFVKFPSERRDVESLTMWVKTLAGTA
jgi:adenylyl-sulfate reductase (glutathione)